MKQKIKVSLPHTQLTALRPWCVALVALLAVWRLPQVLAISEQSTVFTNNALSLVLFAAFALLLIRAFGQGDRRLKGIAYGLGLLFSCFMTVGKVLRQNGAFAPPTVLSTLDMLLTVAVFAVLLGATVVLLYEGILHLSKRAEEKRAQGKPETRLSRIVGNGWFVLGLLLLCWLPVWLAFWPGTFRYDAPTQFATYMDATITSAHPILHTLFVGACLNYGIETDTIATGIALCSGIQLLIMAAILAYACHWLWKRGVPLWARVCVIALLALFPLYPLWAFSITKDVLFSGFMLLLLLECIDLRRGGLAVLRNPWRIARFVLIAVMMMLLRSNGVYAFVLAIPLVVLAAKGARWRACLVCVVAVGLYALSAWGLQCAVEGEGGSSVELFSVPLQQIARVVSKNRDALSPEELAILEEIYADDMAEIYDPQFADPIKWALDNDTFDSNRGRYLGLWLKLGIENPGIYAEAFLMQNLAYYDPSAPMRYNIVLGCEAIEMYPMEAVSLLPELRQPYMDYDQTLTFLSIPGTYLLSNTALMSWLCMLCLGLAIYRRRRGTVLGCSLLLLLWLTCLLGPVAIMRYMLVLFYGVPVLLAHTLGLEE